MSQVASREDEPPAMLWRLRTSDIHTIHHAFPELLTSLLQFLQVGCGALRWRPSLGGACVHVCCKYC